MSRRRYASSARLLLPRLLVLACAGLGIPQHLRGQDTPTQTPSPPVFKVNVRTVVLDVVVTGKNGQPVQGLRSEDFAIAEDGKPQTVTNFEEHTSARLAESATPVPAAALPPNTFTNIPPVPPTDSLTVLLLDSLNTPQEDQRFVKAQILEFLKKVQPGRRMAIFTLGSELRFVQGFSDDPAALKAALNDPRLGTTPQSSPLLQSDQEKNANQTTLANMQQYNAAAAAALGKFLNEQRVEQTDVRTKLTLTAFQNLGHYLAGFPGRKNILWFSGAFPLTLFPSGGSLDTQRFQDEAVKQTDALLTAAQIAVYPIGAQGVRTSVIFDAEHQLPGLSAAPAPPPPAGSTSAGNTAAASTSQTQRAIQQIASDTQAESQDRNASQSSMDQIAHDTGGIAIMNTNGLVQAIDRAVAHGSDYYTLSYTPADSPNDGNFRKLQVKLAGDSHVKGAHLAYRQGYFATNPTAPATPNASQPTLASSPAPDPLRPLMDLGMPASTQVPLLIRVRRTAADSNPAGSNTALQGARARYAVTFLLKAKDLQFNPAPDGTQHDRLEATLLVYSQEGKPLNWLVRELDLDLNAAHYKQIQANGIPIALQIDAPIDAIALRGGVYDLNAAKAGTLELPLSQIAEPPPSQVAETEPAPLDLADNVSTKLAASAADETANPPAATTPMPQPTSSVANAVPPPNSTPASKAIPNRESIAFWSQPPEKVDPLLLHVPADNISRYSHLRQDFHALHCTGELMQEQPIDRKTRKNLICTLPGKDTSAPIVVVARYDRKKGDSGASQRWGEVLMLPLLFNAMHTEQRLHTFIFVALDGEAGEEKFFDELTRQSTQPPTALIVLDALGLAPPRIATSGDEGYSKKSRARLAIDRTLATEATVSANVLRLPSLTRPYETSMPAILRSSSAGSFGNRNWFNSTIERENQLPSILIYSADESPTFSPGQTPSPDLFHKTFDFIAYTLCRVDLRLAASDETALF